MIWLVPLLAFAFSFALTALLIRLAPHLGLVDLPDPRKVHTQPTPRAGGLAIFTAFAVASLFHLDQQNIRLIALGLPIVLLGLADDRWQLSWKLRLAVQFLIAVAAVLFLLSHLPWPLYAPAVFWIVLLVNAFNMLDNMDALSAGVAAIALGMLTIAGGELHTGLTLLGAIFGFLCWNRPPARIFMGDAGSTLLGFAVAVLTLQRGTLPEAPPWSILATLALAAVPCYDSLTVVLIRLKEGRSPFHADKRHLSHRLVDSGLPGPWAVRVIHVLALASGIGGLLLYRVTDWSQAGLVFGQLTLGWSALALFEFGPRRRRS